MIRVPAIVFSSSETLLLQASLNTNESSRKAWREWSASHNLRQTGTREFAILRHLSQRHASIDFGDDGLLLSGDSHNWRRKHFNPLRAKVCPKATPHSLRHGFATIMLEEGIPMKVVSAQLGHSSTRITEDTYSHVTARLQREAGEAIERVLVT